MDKEQAIELLEHLAWDRDIDRNLYGEALNMAIDALKEQLSKEGTTSDLIGRKAALKAINSWRGRFSEEYNEAIDDCENSIKELPTIQPEKAQLYQQGTTSDLISKTETVEHLRRVLEATVPNTDYDEGFIDGVEFGISTVSTMPIVQPEPKEGHWIWAAGELMCSECHTVYSDLYPDYDNAVACPHCGARMKGV